MENFIFCAVYCPLLLGQPDLNAITNISILKRNTFLYEKEKI